MKTTASTAQLRTLVNGLSIEELRELNAIVCSEIKLHSDMRQRKAAAKLAVGSSVTFASKYGLQKGVVVKINQKTVGVKTDMGNWKVSPTLLNVVA